MFTDLLGRAISLGIGQTEPVVPLTSQIGVPMSSRAYPSSSWLLHAGCTMISRYSAVFLPREGKLTGNPAASRPGPQGASAIETGSGAAG